MKNRIIAVLLSAFMLAGAATPLAYAAGGAQVEIDIGGLYGPDDSDNTGDTENGGDSGSTETPDTGNGNENENENENNSGDSSDNGGGSSEDYYPDDRYPPVDYNPGSGSTEGSGDNSGNKEETPTEEPKTDDTDKDPVTTEPVTPEVVYVDFYDVPETEWYYNDVRELSAMKVIEGYTNGSFQPNGYVTRAEFLKMIVTLLCGDQTFTTSDRIFEDVDPNEWYSMYIATSIVYGFIDSADYGGKFEPNKAITRREAAKVMVNALGLLSSSDLRKVFSVYKSPYADTNDHNITALYGLCIMQGSIDPVSGARVFEPDSNITRAESAAVLCRINKLVTDQDNYMATFKSTYDSPELQILYAPQSSAAFYDEFTNAWDNTQAFLTYSYPYSAFGDSMRIVKEQCFRGYVLAAEHRPEFSTHISVEPVVENAAPFAALRLDFVSDESGYTLEELYQMQAAAKEKADEVAGVLASETDGALDKADAIHAYLKETVEYDLAETPDALSYTAYGALVNGKAVCQGYSGAFNLLCRASAVKALAVANKEHMWNVVLADEGMYHYDVTADDSENYETDRYRGIAQGDFVPDDVHLGYVLPEIYMF